MSELKEELEELRQEIEDTWEPWMKDAAHWEGGDGANILKTIDLTDDDLDNLMKDLEELLEGIESLRTFREGTPYWEKGEDKVDKFLIKWEDHIQEYNKHAHKYLEWETEVLPLFTSEEAAKELTSETKTIQWKGKLYLHEQDMWDKIESKLIVD